MASPEPPSGRREALPVVAPPLWRPVPEHLWRSFPEVVPREMLHDDGLLVAFGFHCNLACTFCMIEDMLDAKHGASLEAFRRFAADPEAMRGIRRIIFSGGEATLESELFDYVAVARGTPGIEHVRIQTNATRLKSRDYLRHLVEAGVDEFFVSVHAHDQATSERITRVRTAHHDLLVALENLAAQPGATLLTNTALVRQNYLHLSDIVRLVAPYGPAKMELWNHWPRIDPADERGHTVPLQELNPQVHAALETARSLGLTTSLKWYPRCQLGPWAHLLDNSQPTALIDLDHWDKTPPHACLFGGVCSHANEGWECAGLSHAYVKQYGWEETLLRPNRRPAEESRTSASTAHRPVGDEWLSRLGLRLGAAFAGFHVTQARLTDGAVRLQLDDGAGGSAFVELLPRARGERGFHSTQSFTLRHGPRPAGAEAAFSAMLRVLASTLEAADPGGLSLPSG